jgi:hypothetical protein
VRGDLEKPDLAAIVDTGYEASSTWAYHDSVIVPALATVGVTLHRVPQRGYATVGLYSSKGDILIPAFTYAGKLPTFCSNEWKRRVLQRWARERTNGAWRVWLGISLDESRRVRVEDRPWQTRYPLIELRMRREECKALVSSMGWPSPPRSSCWMCPNRTRAEWDALKREAPKDFARAVAFESEMQSKAGLDDDELWLTATRRPLSEWQDDGQADLFTGLCDSGYCFI